jgi:succinoglycan biosynthesis protein ExoA
VYNEEIFIRQLVNFFLTAKPLKKELILVDGGSTDSTVEIVWEQQQLHDNIILMHNPDQYVPFALNMAIKKAKGDIIIRLDAHCTYAPDYFERIIDAFKRTGADIVGGPTRTAYTNVTQQAVAHAICTKFAIGNSRVHQLDYEGLTDSVTFGAWKKDIFEITGFFDEELVRNQDDEFHYRAKSKGCKIWQDPSIKLFYYPRNSFKGLFRQYFQYGQYKPSVLKKVSSGIQYRHIIPAAFTLYITSLPLAIFSILWLLPLLLYMAINFTMGVRSSLPFKTAIQLFAVYPCIHIAYGSGFLAGLKKLF